jgi:hypothetical protein
VRLTDAYADVTGTLVHLVTSNTYNYPLGAGGRLSLASGYVLKETIGGYSGGSDVLIVDEPLSPQDFSPNVEIIASVGFSPPVYMGFYPPTMPPAPPWLNDLDHVTIRVPFTINPPRLGGFIYHQTPTVKQGIGVQVQSLDYSPAHSSCLGEAGGARIEVRFTGLPADLELLSFIRVESRRYSIASSCDGGGTGSSGNLGSGRFALTIPGMSLGIPVMTLLQSPAWPTDSNEPSSEPTVGSAGTVELEVAFPGSGTPTGQPATLTISDIQALINNPAASQNINTPNVPTLPTYQITLPLR